MKKMPTLFLRDPDDLKRVTDVVNPAAAWVIEGEGVATRKYDGTCVMRDEDGWWARREVRPGKTPPPGFVAVETDPVTGKTQGWEPMAQSAFVRFFHEAWGERESADFGTYELCGPKINANPEGFSRHVLIGHAEAEELDTPRDRDGLREWLLARPHMEGIVWHRPDGRMAKLKRKDFTS